MTSPPATAVAQRATLLRLEGAVVLAAAVVAYRQTGWSWGLFAALFLVPDVSMLGYLRGARVGARCYNAMHTYIAPGACATASLVAGWPLAIPLIWVAHIGFDRALGYGLKLDTGFRDTHLGRIGRGA